MGKAYTVFLKRAGEVDNKNIILTPEHISRLMINLANLNKDDVVLDSCMGSGGFLLEAMDVLISKAERNQEKINAILKNQLIGFESDPVLFALAFSNMYLRGIAQTNLIFRSSLAED